MKKLIYIATVAAMSMSMASCEDFLDADLVTGQTSDNFPTTEEQANDVLTGIYAHLLFESPEDASSTYLAQLAADECLGGNLSQSNNCATNFLMYSGSLNGHSALWSRCYTLIHRANSALESFKNVTAWSL